MRQWTRNLGLVAAVLFQPSCAPVQQPTTAPLPGDQPISVGTDPAPAGRVIPVGQPAGYHGIGIRGRAGGNGWADYPVIVRVEEGSPAQKAGLLVGDVMLAVDGTDARQFGALTAAQVGRTFVIWVRRGEEVSPFTLTTVANPRTQP